MAYDRPDKGKTRIPHAPQVKCTECSREVPRSGAQTREGSDYTLYFCDLRCFEKWRAENPDKGRGLKGN